jgi:chromosome segregation ATPase
MDIEKLKLLETRIETILTQHATIVQERDRLSEQLGRAQSRMKEITDQLQRYEQERSELRLRVERLLTRLEGLNLG